MTAGCRAIDPIEAIFQEFLYTMSNIEPADSRIYQQEHNRNSRSGNYNKGDDHSPDVAEYRIAHWHTVA
jgi:hypothetical protein